MNITLDKLLSEIDNVLQKEEFKLIAKIVQFFLHSRNATKQRNIT